MARNLTNSDAYEAVLKHFYVGGKRHGAKTAMAKALNLSGRAVTDRWERYGIPMKYASQIKKLTGMLPHQVWPENF